MSINLSGKYWRLKDLEKKFSKSVSIIYPIIKSLAGVKRIGSVILVPDYIMPILRKKIGRTYSYNLSSAAFHLGISKKLLKELITGGLPAWKADNQEPRIWKSQIPALKNAIAIIRQKYGKFNESHIAEALKIAMGEKDD